MEAVPCDVTTQVSAAITPSTARALVRVHSVGMDVLRAACDGSEDALAEATGVFVIAFANYRAKLAQSGDRSVTLVMTADQHTALADVKNHATQLTDVLSGRYSNRALSIAHFELVRSLDLWRNACRQPPPVFRGATALHFDPMR